MIVGEASALMKMCKMKLSQYTHTELYAIAVGLRTNATCMYPEAVGEIVDVFGEQTTALIIELYLRARDR